MRLISFSMTEKSFVAGTKTVTRRLGWQNLKPGDRLMGVNKCMGFKPGEKPRFLGEIEVVSVRRERLDAITLDDVKAEGVAGCETVEAFVSGFCKAMKCQPDTEVARIEFRKVAPRG